MRLLDWDTRRRLSRLLSWSVSNTDTKMALFKFKGKRPGYESRQSSPQDSRNNRWPLLWRPPPPHPSILLQPPYVTLHIPPSVLSPDPPLSPPRCGLQQTVAPNPHPSQSSNPRLFSFLPLICTVLCTCLINPVSFFIIKHFLKDISSVGVPSPLVLCIKPKFWTNSESPVMQLLRAHPHLNVFPPFSPHHQKLFLHRFLLLSASTSTTTISLPPFCSCPYQSLSSTKSLSSFCSISSPPTVYLRIPSSHREKVWEDISITQERGRVHEEVLFTSRHNMSLTDMICP